MVFGGITATTSEDHSVAFVNGRVIPIASSGVSQSVSCRRPETPKDDCEITAASVSRALKDDYGTAGRNLLIGVGWVAFVVPGLVLSIVFHQESETTGASADGQFVTAYVDCMQRQR